MRKLDGDMGCRVPGKAESLLGLNYAGEDFVSVSRRKHLCNIYLNRCFAYYGFA